MFNERIFGRPCAGNRAGKAYIPKDQTGKFGIADGPHFKKHLSMRADVRLLFGESKRIKKVFGNARLALLASFKDFDHRMSPEPRQIDIIGSRHCICYCKDVNERGG
jgi:hypothetical protein